MIKLWGNEFSPLIQLDALSSLMGRQSDLDAIIKPAFGFQVVHDANPHRYIDVHGFSALSVMMFVEYIYTGCIPQFTCEMDKHYDTNSVANPLFGQRHYSGFSITADNKTSEEVTSFAAKPCLHNKRACVIKALDTAVDLLVMATQFRLFGLHHIVEPIIIHILGLVEAKTSAVYTTLFEEHLVPSVIRMFDMIEESAKTYHEAWDIEGIMEDTLTFLCNHPEYLVRNDSKKLRAYLVGERWEGAFMKATANKEGWQWTALWAFMAAERDNAALKEESAEKMKEN